MKTVIMFCALIFSSSLVWAQSSPPGGGSGANLSVGKTFGLFETYLGFGTIQQAGVLSGSGTVDLFGSPTTITTKQELQHSSSLMYAGTQMRFGSYNVGLEFSRMFEIDNSSLKLGYEF